MNNITNNALTLSRESEYLSYGSRRYEYSLDSSDLSQVSTEKRLQASEKMKKIFEGFRKYENLIGDFRKYEYLFDALDWSDPEDRMSAVSSRAADLSPNEQIFSTVEKTKKIYADFVQARVKKAKSPTLVNRVSKQLERLWGATDSVSAARNAVGLFAPAALTVFGTLAILGGTLLSTSGLMLLLVKADALAQGILHKSREKMAVAFADLVAGFSAFVTGLFFVMEWAATFSKNILVAAVAGAALPIAVMCLYVVSLASSIYKVFVGSKFQSELRAALGKEDLQGISETLKWIRQKTQLTEKEINAHATEARGDEKNFAQRVISNLHNKWDEFALRAYGEVFQFMKDPLQATALDDLINRLDGGDLTALTEAKTMIHAVQEKSQEGLKWSRVAILSNIIGMTGMITYLIFASYITSAVASAFFAIAATIAIFADSSTVRAWTKKVINRLEHQKGELTLSEACSKPTSPNVIVKAIIACAKRALNSMTRSDETEDVRSESDSDSPLVMLDGPEEILALRQAQ
jgi:hypothetical protein